MTADEAFKKANEIKRKKAEEKLNNIKESKQFKIILDKINIAAEKGQMALTINENNKSFAEPLRTLGYKVEFYGDKEMNINWCCRE